MFQKEASVLDAQQLSKGTTKVGYLSFSRRHRILARGLFKNNY